MSDDDPIGTEKDRALWARLKAAARTDSASEAAVLPDADVAAWLEGRLPPEAAARVEARLAAEPALLDRALDAAAALREATQPPPERVVTRAQALVGFEAERQARGSGGLHRWLGQWRRQFEIALVASAFVLVCVTGFSLGGVVQEAYAEDSFDIAEYAINPFVESEISLFMNQGGGQ